MLQVMLCMLHSLPLYLMSVIGWLVIIKHMPVINLVAATNQCNTDCCVLINKSTDYFYHDVRHFL